MITLLTSRHGEGHHAAAVLAAELGDERYWAVHPPSFPACVARGRAPAARAVRALTRMAGNVAVLSLIGPYTERSPGVSLRDFGKAFDEAVNASHVGGIALDIGSPGGGLGGTPETAEKIYRARGVKPIYAVANSLAASGAFWLASQADKLFAAPGSQLGSIGVFAMHVDESEANRKAGVKVSLIEAPRGGYKTETSPFKALTPEARAKIQHDLDAYNGMFVNAVAVGRGAARAIVRTQWGEGRLLLARDALKVGMIDGIATLGQVIGRLATRQTDARAARLRAISLENRISQLKAAGIPLPDQPRIRGLVVDGYAALYNVPAYSQASGNWELVVPGTFDQSLASGCNVPCLVGHDSAKQLAETSDGTFRVWSNRIGLAYELRLADSDVGWEALQDIKLGRLTGASIRFAVKQQRPGPRGQELTDLWLREVSLTDRPAWPGTSVSLRRTSEPS